MSTPTPCRDSWILFTRRAHVTRQRESQSPDRFPLKTQHLVFSHSAISQPFPARCGSPEKSSKDCETFCRSSSDRPGETGPWGLSFFDVPLIIYTDVMTGVHIWESRKLGSGNSHLLSYTIDRNIHFFPVYCANPTCREQGPFLFVLASTREPCT